MTATTEMETTPLKAPKCPMTSTNFDSRLSLVRIMIPHCDRTVKRTFKRNFEWFTVGTVVSLFSFVFGVLYIMMCVGYVLARPATATATPRTLND